ncbi:MAG: ATP-binding protein [Bacteroidota bacterium]
MPRNHPLAALIWCVIMFSVQFNVGANIEEKRAKALDDSLSPSERISLLKELTFDFKPLSSDSVAKYSYLLKELAEKQNDPLSLSFAYRQLGWAEGIMQQDIPKLLQFGQQALQLAEQEGDEVAIAESGLRMITGYLATQNVAKAQEFIQMGKDVGKKNNLPTLVYEALNFEAYLTLLSDPMNSLEIRKEALQLAVEMNDSIRMGNTLSQISNILKFQKDSTALASFQRTKEIFDRLHAPLFESMFLFYFAEYNGDLGYSDSLLTYSLKAIELAEKSNNVQAKRVVTALLYTYYSTRGEFEASLPYARKALAMEQQKPTINYVSAFLDIARNMAGLGKSDSAEYYYQGALAGTKMLPFPRVEILARTYYGEFLAQEGKLEAALEQLRTAESIGKDKEEAAVRDLLLTVLAKVEFDLKNFNEAKKYYQEAIDLGNTENEADLLSLCYQGMASCDSAMGDWQSAYKNKLLHFEWSDSLVNRQFSDQVAELETQYETALKEAQIIELEKQKEIDRNRFNFILGIAILLALTGLVVGILSLRLRNQNIQINEQKNELSELNQTKDQLFGMIAHDLRGPITGFQSAGKIFDHYLQKEDYDKLSSISQRINTQSFQLRQLLDNLLNWSLQQLGRYQSPFEEVQIESLGQEIMNRYSPSAEAKNNQLELDVSPDLKWTGDKNGLSVILNNLIGNSIKFTENGQIKLHAGLEGNKIQLILSDTGQGMSQELAESLFSQAHTTSTKGTAGEKGTGLGTEIVRQLVDRLNGEISVSSQPGQGTEVKILLPSPS